MSRYFFVARALLFMALLAIPSLACDFSFALGNASTTPTSAPTVKVELPTATARAQVPTVTPVPVVNASPTAAPKISSAASTGIITSVVLARAYTQIVHAPLGITSTFPPDGKINVNLAISDAPSGTAIRAVWSVISATGVQPNAEITRYQTTTQGSRYLNIEFYGTSRLPVGTFKIDVFLNDKLDRTLNFDVKENVAAFQLPTPAIIGSCPPPPKPVYRPPLVARKLTMAEGVKKDTVEPINATRLFKPASVFHAIIELDSAPANSEIKIVWYALDTGGLEPCNTSMGEVKITSNGTRSVWFDYRPPEKWHLGTYKAEIFVNGNLNIDVDFRVQ